MRTIRWRLIMMALLVAAGTGLMGAALLHPGRVSEPPGHPQTTEANAPLDRTGEQRDSLLAVKGGDVVQSSGRTNDAVSGSRRGGGNADAPGEPETRHPAPGLDCAFATSWSELAICASVGLADLDVRLNEVFRLVSEHLNPDEFQRVRTEQTEWLSERDDCSVLTSEDAQSLCLARVIQTRVDHLARYLGSPR